MRSISNGQADTEKFAALIDMEPPSKQESLAKYNAIILDAVERAAEDSVSAAGADLRTSVLGPREADPVTPTDECANVTVSFDGSWSTRGFSSQYGFSSAVGIKTKKVLDWHTASRLCNRCQVLEHSPLDKESQEWQDRKEEHDAHCMRNHAGSAKSMESDGAEILWSRSEEKHRLRYTTFVGDGDSSSYGRVAQLQPYGQAHAIEKEECVGHIQKRMGTMLREFVKCNKGKKLSDLKGVTGRNRLTKARINSLQFYYGRAIRSNVGDVEGMKRAVMAILKHSRSTDEKPEHELCPTGATSWCKYQRLEAAGE